MFTLFLTLLLLLLTKFSTPKFALHCIIENNKKKYIKVISVTHITRWLCKLVMSAALNVHHGSKSILQNVGSLVAHQRTQHSIAVRPTAVRAISTDIICQTIVQHCSTPDFELTATCCVKLCFSLVQMQT